MVLIKTSKAVSLHRKMKRSGTAHREFKGVLHPDHLPATIGLMGFVVVFSLSLLKVSLGFMNIPMSQPEQTLEMFPLSGGTEDVMVTIVPATEEFTVGEANDLVVTMTPEDTQNRITGFDLRLDISGGMQVNHPDAIAKFDKQAVTGPIAGTNTLRLAFSLTNGQDPQPSVSFVLKVKKSSVGSAGIIINAAGSEIVGTHVTDPGVIDYHGVAVGSGSYTFVAEDSTNLCGGVTCSANKTCCGNQCKSLTDDESNCGSCGNICATGQMCTNSACVGGTTTNPCTSYSCTNGHTCQACGSTCKDFTVDDNNCGSCGNVCGSGKDCQNGSCVSTNSGSTGSTTNNYDCNDTIPDRPGNFAAVSGPNKGEITLSWSKANHADYYSMHFGTKWLEFNDTRNNLGNADTTKYVVRGLTTGTAYYFQLWAVNGCAKSKPAKGADGRDGIAQWSGLGSKGTGGGSTTPPKTSSGTGVATPKPTVTPTPIPTTTETDYDWEQVEVTGSKGSVDIDEDEYYTYESGEEDEDVIVTRDDGSQVDTSIVDADGVVDAGDQEDGFDVRSLLQYWPLGVGLLLAVIIAVIIISIKNKQSELEYYEERLGGKDDELPNDAGDHEVAAAKKVRELTLGAKKPMVSAKPKTAQQELDDLTGNLS